MARGNKSKKKTVEDVEHDFDFEADVSIDPFHLDAEVLGYPRLVSQYAGLAAEANRDAKQASERVKTLRSELVKEAWADPTVLGKGVKPTVQTVEAYYRNDEDYQAAKEEFIEAEYEADIINGVVDAIRSKRYMLDGSLRLISLEFFSSPKVPHDLQDVVAKMKESGRSATMDRMREVMAERS